MHAHSNVLLAFAGLDGHSEHDTLILKALNALHAKGHAVRAMLALPDPSLALMMVGPGVMPSVGGAAMEAVARAQDQLRKRVEAFCAAAEVPFEFQVGDPSILLPQSAALADLFVVSPATARGQTPLSDAFEAALMRLRLPVWVASASEPPAQGPVAIAWDGGMEALRAVRAGLPFLHAAADVIVLQDPDSIDAGRSLNPQPDALIQFLARHDVSARTVLAFGGMEGLSEAARNHGASVLLTGAYGHARAMEWVFGGATRSMLAQDRPFNMLLAH
jgi:nucleotide-binding universal stress UspA family protein